MRTHTYKKSSDFLRRHGAQYPEMLRPDAWAEYMAIRAAEEHVHAAAEQRRATALIAARLKSQAKRREQRYARRLRLAEILHARPEAQLKAVMAELGCSKSTLRRDRIALGLLGTSEDAVCPTCRRTIDGQPIEASH